MRGEANRQEPLFSYVSLESRVPEGHSLRQIKQLTSVVLREIGNSLEGLYSDIGRPSVPPETLIKSQLLIALFSVRSDRAFCERLQWDLLFRWFLDMSIDQSGFDASVFSKNRKRLLDQEVAQEFLVKVVALARRENLLSDEQFTVDGTLIESWASSKSFKPNDDQGKDGRDFHGESRSNATHRSTTDPEAALARKSPGKEAKLSFCLNLLNDNRHGLIVDACLETPDGYAERRAALKMIDRQSEDSGINVQVLAADKGYASRTFVDDLKQRRIRPHIAVNNRYNPGIGPRTMASAAYKYSQRRRKLVEQPFGWLKVVAGFRKSRFVGKAKTELYALFAISAYNLLRIANLLIPAPPHAPA